MKKAAAAGITWPLPEGWDEKRIEEALFGEQRPVDRSRERAVPDFPSLHEELQRHRHLTLQLAWEEYRQTNPQGYHYSRFCALYQRWRGKQNVVLRQEHKPGEKGFVDWAGATIPMHDPVTGEVWPASLFVMVLGSSSYTYAEATRDQQLAAWINAHIHAFEYFSGVPRLLIPDNLRTGVSRACRYDPDLNPTYQEFAMHYAVGVVPARPYRARDKAKVAGSVKTLALPPRSPNLNAYAERWVRSVKEECLAKLILLGEGSLRRALRHYEAHYHEERNHQGKDNVLLFPLPTQAVRGEQEKVRCRERLGGLLKYYEREAA